MIVFSLIKTIDSTVRKPQSFSIKVTLFLFLFAVTGSCFFIFSSALKASAGYLAKSSIVEGRKSSQRRSPWLASLQELHFK